MNGNRQVKQFVWSSACGPQGVLFVGAVSLLLRLWLE